MHLCGKHEIPEEGSELKKVIYAVKSGRKTGIFNEWLKCSEQTNKYPNSKFRRFEYRSELEEEPEDVPGSLRYAIKEAEEYLGELVYLGESADCLEAVSWAEDGFLPFGDESEAEAPGFFSDRREPEEDIDDIDEEYSKWLAGSRNTLDVPLGYWKTAEDMKKYIQIIKSQQSMEARSDAAEKLKLQLKKCASDAALSELTAIYKDKKEENAIGYNPPAVYWFVEQLANRYPKPKAIEPEDVEDGASLRQLLMQAGAVESELTKRIRGQDAAIEKLSEAYFSTELKARLTPDRRGPRSAYLLAGPPGVGKTFMAQRFAKKLGFPFKRFDMSGYSNKVV